MLQYFDPSKPVKISVDASSKGMSAVLLQDEGPVAYASKSLTSDQQNYGRRQNKVPVQFQYYGCKTLRYQNYTVTQLNSKGKNPTYMLAEKLCNHAKVT